ncbi:MAG TPA: helix-turn-helix domain-containing GNAT family N-acetyltransferase [Terriglobales bacterium]|nr:helix-turn-helix domain-containing GNAT family N-acetyltransferase [Terriglobales bacterium]
MPGPVSHQRRQDEFHQRVQAVRRFNRFYTRQIGILQEGVYESPFSLTEVRVLYELAHQDGLTAVQLCRELGLDAGYASRILRVFERKGLIARKPSDSDGREMLLSLTARGREVFAPLDDRSSDDIAKMLGRLSPEQQARLAEATRTIEHLLSPKATGKPPYVLRTHQPGDMGWVTYRHGVLYSQEYGYDERFEALVAGIVADFVKNFDVKRERCWIAEIDGERVGSVFLVKKSKTVAKLRLLMVEPSARGLGIGKRLVAECIRFARQAGYKKVVLWTQSELHAARGIYEQAGFKLAGKKPHESWSRKGLVSEVWELKL